MTNQLVCISSLFETATISKKIISLFNDYFLAYSVLISPTTPIATENCNEKCHGEKFFLSHKILTL